MNGNAKGWFKAAIKERGPVSPFLFTIAVDVLSRLQIRAKERGILERFLVERRN